MSEVVEGFLSHLKELQWRLRLALIVYVAGVLLLMNWSAPVFDFMAAPLLGALPAGTPMIFLNAPDVFFTYLKIALLGSLFATSPLTFYQLWAFIAPGLYQEEKRLFLFSVIASVLLFTGGGAFAYFLVFPMVFQFFLGFATDQIHALPAIKEYLSLFLKMVFAFGLSFQIPIVLTVLARLNIATPEGMAKQRRYVIVWVFIAAAILTPPDIISQVLLAVPMLLLYEIGLVVARMSVRDRGDSVSP
ncbi:MAG: twin-arginine translocase subunit TatC [Zetaproteobacteria bacterium CG12_big_fil_rev_8_21_14_0_65_54_13]|nr:MAG: twin-arginine translocase subunit TatC [Zetaproteobacteria bacterium CG23_combo_of_CG06-09_8_20_14_all_54_7]PIW47942.1 MAG: twin-arginine translocase subunit TatC [Zetaproteobacteria bacterium CG12_big_fil_rev_8_21_14_0_65_54_13]PIX53796.1 MAG: twin-arginine translocase subunit TatC [Zetaproteobacteria bacterium CG_4_10_14_3_um_filter_54_28]PJA30862.1 MAG: twin-arginine translocase subunit TatC [Zetaproteobacteria bacterium CG_4_9_14_3_um_filter_54_145]